MTNQPEGKMEDQQVEWINDPNLARKWAADWAKSAKTGSHWPVKMIHKAATAFKDRWCTDGLWRPGAEGVYWILREQADFAQEFYEEAQSAMEA